VREDVTWKDVVAKYNKERPYKKGQIIRVPSSRRVGVYEKSRSFFEQFAKEKNFEPLVASNWYNISRKEVSQVTGNPLELFNISLIRALMIAFPHLEFEADKFLYKPLRYWENKTNQRKFLVTFAKQKGFDASMPVNWYKFLSTPENRTELRKTVLLQHYDFNLHKTLFHVFPDIGLEHSKFSQRTSNNYWKDKSNQQKCLSSFAKRKGFDPLIPAMWREFLQTKENRKELRTISFVNRYYKSNGCKALREVFPEIGLEFASEK